MMTPSHTCYHVHTHWASVPQTKDVQGIDSLFTNTNEEERQRYRGSEEGMTHKVRCLNIKISVIEDFVYLYIHSGGFRSLQR